MGYRDTLDEISRAQYDAAMVKASAAIPRKNEIVDAVGFGLLDESDLSAFAGIEGDANDARIYHDLEIFGGVSAVLVLCDEHLGLVYCDERDDMHGYQLSGVPRLVRELVAAYLVKFHETNAGVELGQHVLDRLGFESVF
jgi:hypothetical protein